MKVDSNSLSGTSFLYEGGLYEKTILYDEVVRIFDGVHINNFASKMVEPVKVRITVDKK